MLIVGRCPFKPARWLMYSDEWEHPFKIIRLDLIFSLSRCMCSEWISYFSLVSKSCINSDFDSAISSHLIFPCRWFWFSGLSCRELHNDILILSIWNKFWVCYLISVLLICSWTLETGSYRIESKIQEVVFFNWISNGLHMKDIDYHHFVLDKIIALNCFKLEHQLKAILAGTCPSFLLPWLLC
jgi:hypothetical protein